MPTRKFLTAAERRVLERAYQVIQEVTERAGYETCVDTLGLLPDTTCEGIDRFLQIATISTD